MSNDTKGLLIAVIYFIDGMLVERILHKRRMKKLVNSNYNSK